MKQTKKKVTDNSSSFLNPDTAFNKELQKQLYNTVSRDIDAGLRVFYLNRQLIYRNDLSKKERRAIQSRKNTIIFRERRRRDNLRKIFKEIWLNETDHQVSSFYFIC